jgi:hypothetical protein
VSGTIERRRGDGPALGGWAGEERRVIVESGAGRGTLDRGPGDLAPAGTDEITAPPVRRQARPPSGHHRSDPTGPQAVSEHPGRAHAEPPARPAWESQSEAATGPADDDLEQICFAVPPRAALLPRPDAARPAATDRLLTDQIVALASALGGIVTAISLGLVGYWLVTGRWPFPLGY